MKNVSLLLITIGGTLALVVGVAFLFSAKNAVPTGPADAAKVLGQRELTSATSSATSVQASGAAEVKNKPVLVVFSDFECPACGSLENSFLMRARKTYGDRMNFVFRNFPLDTIHPYARMAAWAAEAAREDGKFWEFHDLLFENQVSWTSLKSKEAVKEQLIQYALQLNIDKDKFIARMDSDVVKKVVETDVSDGLSLQVNSTPTIYLNNNITAPQDLATQVQALLGN